MNCEINAYSRFDRKHYFYPDSPKGYQITQFYHPIIGEGYVELPSGTKLRIEHAHLEGDAGKLTHFDNYSLVDLNRVDTPLIEIVSMPDIHSAKDAHDYCKALWRLMCFAGVTYGDLYNGNMRFDVNISIAPEGSKELGIRAEVKNLNSFRSAERAAEYEIKRQTKLLESGEKVVQETRGWNDATGKTTGQRSKEEAKDYRYMPEPDLPPINLTKEFIDEESAKLPLMPSGISSRRPTSMCCSWSTTSARLPKARGCLGRSQSTSMTNTSMNMLGIAPSVSSFASALAPSRITSI
jgi:aspartyl-tRNA(Asn)/glutamyl-tRNA(Gln) amidotransferase subunit B